jgi:hypothetical protein
MKLSDIELTQVQVAAFRRLLDAEVHAEEMRQGMADRERAESALYEQRYEKLTGLAREWARKNGNIEGMPAHLMAGATWEAFTCGEGWFSEMDVDEYFSGDDDWQESWETAYMDELSRLAAPTFTRA